MRLSTVDGCTPCPNTLSCYRYDSNYMLHVITTAAGSESRQLIYFHVVAPQGFLSQFVHCLTRLFVLYSLCYYSHSHEILVTAPTFHAHKTTLNVLLQLLKT